MKDELLNYYNRELAMVRTLAKQFAEDYPAVAARLSLSPQSGTDPHVERLISAFAFLTARIRQKIDDDFPEITHAMLGVLYPHYLAPIPSMAIVELELDRGQSGLTDGYPIRRHQALETEPVDGEPCSYRTCYPLTLWPIEVTDASLGPLPSRPAVMDKEVVALLRIRLRTFAQETPFGKLKLETLRFYLNGQAPHIFALYELIFNHLRQVTLTNLNDPAHPVRLGPQSVRPVGFEETEALLPYSPRSLAGHNLLSEYFAFPQKFCFFELVGLSESIRSQLGSEIEIGLYLDQSDADLAHNVSESTFRLGCTPVVNLFRQSADEFVLSHEQSEYRVVADQRRPRACEIYSIERVRGTSPDGDELEYQPFYSFKHAATLANTKAFWLASRRSSSRAEHQVGQGTEVYLSLVDLALNPASPANWVLHVETECLNRDLPERLPSGGGRPQFRLSEGGPLVDPIVCLAPPTPTRRPPLGQGALWRLISHLTLNHLSITGSGESTDALREILRLYDPTDSPETQTRIAGILRVSSRRVSGRVRDDPGGGICRGVRVEVEFDEERFSDHGLFLFASVLERFLGLYAPINSFTQLCISTKQRPRPLRLWEPRNNQAILP